MDYFLHPATTVDLEVVLAWIDSPGALRLWGGHLLTYPPTIDKIWQEIGADDHNTFALVDANASLSGFGQVLPREKGTAHLGRIILSPELRGRGLGSVLVRALINAAQVNFHANVITLNVYRDNLAAVRLYRVLGFLVSAEDSVQNSFSMRLTLDSS